MGHPEAAVTLCAAVNSCLNRSTSARMPTAILPPAGRATPAPTGRPADRLAQPGGQRVTLTPVCRTRARTALPALTDAHDRGHGRTACGCPPTGARPARGPLQTPSEECRPHRPQPADRTDLFSACPDLQRGGMLSACRGRGRCPGLPTSGGLRGLRGRRSRRRHRSRRSRRPRLGHAMTPALPHRHRTARQHRTRPHAGPRPKLTASGTDATHVIHARRCCSGEEPERSEAGEDRF